MKQKEFLDHLRNLDNTGKREARKILGMTPEYTSVETGVDSSFDIGDPNNAKARVEAKLNELYKERLRVVKDTVQAGSFYMRDFEQGGRFRKALQESLIESEKFYGSTDAAKKAFSGLTTGMKSFIGFSETTAKTLMKNTTHFEALGLQTSKLSEILDTAVLSYGLGEEKLDELSKRVMKTAIDLNMPATELATNWAAAQKSLAYTSGKVENIFFRLQKTARTTGIDFSTLTNAFGEQMDTFSGASQVAGRLNAVLGDSIFNSVELLGMNEAERVSTIAERVKRKVGNVDDLKKFELKAVASSMGLSVDETRRLLRGDTSVEKALAAAGMKENPIDAAALGTAKELDYFKKIIMETRSAFENQKQKMYGAWVAGGQRQGFDTLARMEQYDILKGRTGEDQKNVAKMLAKLPPHLRDAVLETGALDPDFITQLVKLNNQSKGRGIATSVSEKLQTRRKRMIDDDPFKDKTVQEIEAARRYGLFGPEKDKEIIKATLRIALLNDASAKKIRAATEDLRKAQKMKQDDANDQKKRTAAIKKATTVLESLEKTLEKSNPATGHAPVIDQAAKDLAAAIVKILGQGPSTVGPGKSPGSVIPGTP